MGEPEKLTDHTHVFHQSPKCSVCGIELGEAIDQAASVDAARRAEVSRELALRKRLEDREAHKRAKGGM